jgi:hypothetical protein
MNWRESLLTAIRQGTYAKGAKAPSVADDPDLLHLLHTYYPESQKGDAPTDEPDRVAIGRALDRPKKREPLEDVLKGVAIELWSDAAGCLFIVADEDDARRLGEPSGTVYTADELRRVVQIGDPAIVLEIHEWKRTFNGRLLK